MKRFALLATLAAAAVGMTAVVPAGAGAAKVKCKVKNAKVNKKGKIKRATVKCPRGKLRGPRGPQGPAGASAVGSGAEITKVHFAVNGDHDNTTLFDDGGVQFQASCDDTNNEIEWRTTKDDAKLTVGVGFFEGDDVEVVDREDFDTGDVIDVDDNDSLRNWVYSAPDGSVVTGILSTHDGDNDSYNGTVDCLVAGHITATP